MERQEPYRVATIVLLREDGAVLMQHRDDKPGLPRAGMWATPGGHPEPGEPIEQCARRELLEETGYRCDDLRLLAALPDVNDVTGQAYTLVVFWSRYDGKQPVTCREGQDLRFLRRAEARTYPIPEVVWQAWDMALAEAQDSAGAAG
jgi:8-oxo-dGTP pyrophosphatase MutT (NUDIX family)